MKAIDFYAMTSVPIHPGALAVHGIDRKTLVEKSHGEYFETQFNALAPILDGCTFVGYNVQFDERMINTTLHHCGLPKYNFPAKSKCLFRDKPVTFDVMEACSIADGKNYNQKLQKQILSEKVKLFLLDLMHRCGRYRMCYSASSLSDTDSMEILNEIFCTICAESQIDAKSNFHSSLYDAFCTWILLCVYGTMFYQ